MVVLGRTFDAIVLDWDGTAVPDRSAVASDVRARVEALVAAGVHVVVVSGTHVGNIDGQLAARPEGPGTLHYALNRGSEVFAVGPAGPALVWRRQASPDEDAALDRAADIAVARFEAFGLTAKIVSQRLNRRKIDIIPEPEWADPPKARIDALLAAVTERLEAHGIDGLAGAVEIGLVAAHEAGLPDPRVTSDAKHVEIGLTDKSDSSRWVLDRMAAAGIGPGLFLVAGDEFGDLGNVTGSDAMMLIPEMARASAVSVGVEPQGVPDGVLHVGGGPSAFLELLDEQLQRRADRRVPGIDLDPGWIVELDGPDTDRRVHESLTALSNGAIGVRGGREEDGEGSQPLVVAGRVYTGAEVPRLLPGPIWPTLMVRRGPNDADRWWLDMRTGTLLRENGDSGRPIRTFRFVSLADPTAMALRAEGPSSRLAPGAGLMPPSGDIAYELHRAGDVETGITRSDSGGGIAVATNTTEIRVAGRRIVERLAAHHADDDRSPGTNEVGERLARARRMGFDVLLARHRTEWARRWADAGVRIHGDADAERAVRFALFHILSAVPSEGEAALGARGLTGPSYSGHVFWDSDVFVLPVLAAVNPPAARAMLEYRVRRLPAARAAAAAAGLPGARFPWESARDGTDVTPRSARGRDGTVIPIRTGQHEEHITADVAWAACEYATWSGDEDFLGADGRGLVLETARYWAGRVRIDAAGRGHLYGMIGPDEYHEPVDDNAFTNVIVRWHLRRAAVLAETAGGATADEVAHWRAVADALVDGYDDETGVYEQFAGYQKLRPLMIADFAPPPVAADLVLGPELVHASQVIKQADVLMLHHMVPAEVRPGSLIPNLDFYLPRTAHGSSLSPAIHAGLLARAGRPNEGLDLFRLACRLDLDDLTGTTAGGVHIATMGGVWQALASGFLGIRPGADGLTVDPCLPDEWESVELTLRFRGRPLQIAATHDGWTVTERTMR